MRDPYAVSRLGERIDELGYRCINLKSDDESDIVALIAAVKVEGWTEI